MTGGKLEIEPIGLLLGVNRSYIWLSLVINFNLNITQESK